jgi:hypothetical protein
VCVSGREDECRHYRGAGGVSRTRRWASWIRLIPIVARSRS